MNISRPGDSSSASWLHGHPCSPAFMSAGSSGIFPRNRTLCSAHIFAQPPLPGEKISVTCLQPGQTKPDIFSTSPRTGSCTFAQKFSSFRTSASATSCGVETIMARTRARLFSGSAKLQLCRIDATDKCSSDVPGGVSMIMILFCLFAGSKPQSISDRNYCTRPCFFGPRMITAVSWSSPSMWPIETARSLSVTVIGHISPFSARSCASCEDVIVGMLGPHTSRSRSATHLSQRSARKNDS